MERRTRLYSPHSTSHHSEPPSTPTSFREVIKSIPRIRRQPTPWEVAADAIHNRRVSIAAISALENYVDAGEDADDDADFDDPDNPNAEYDVESNSDAHTSLLSTSISTSTTSTLSTSSGAFATAPGAATHTSDFYDTSTTTTSSKDYPSGNATADILLSDTISIKSYKSEI